MTSSRIFALVGGTVFLFYLIYHIYVGIMHPIPGLGDSWDYHIPISKMILNGTFLAPSHVRLVQWYYPGSAEAINSLLIFLQIPLTLSNVFAIIVLFFVCWKLAGVFGLAYYEAFFFATTIVTLNVFVRWYSAVSVDIWLAIFFLISLVFLERPKRSVSYFLQLGFFLGMLIGTKYSGWYYLVILLFVYSRQLREVISTRGILTFLLPFSFFGLFWYIRNEILVSNPFFPMIFFNLPGGMNFPFKVWNVAISRPKEMLDSFFAEYKIWVLSLPIAVFSFINMLRVKKFHPLSSQDRLFMIGIFCFIVFLISPSEKQSWIIVSSFRYSYVTFIPLILGVFLWAKSYSKLQFLSLISIASMIVVSSLMYYPKLTLFYIPAVISMAYVLERYKLFLRKLFS